MRVLPTSVTVLSRKMSQTPRKLPNLCLIEDLCDSSEPKSDTVIASVKRGSATNQFQKVAKTGFSVEPFEPESALPPLVVIYEKRAAVCCPFRDPSGARVPQAHFVPFQKPPNPLVKGELGSSQKVLCRTRGYIRKKGSGLLPFS